jgi:hypothetical protein
MCLYNTYRLLHTSKIHSSNYKPRTSLPVWNKKLVYLTLTLLTLSTKAYNLYIKRHSPRQTQAPNDTLVNRDYTPENSSLTSLTIPPLYDNSYLKPTNKFFIPNIIQGTSTSINDLMSTAQKLQNHNDFTIYTDGSLVGIQTTHCRMGFRWFEPELNMTYMGSCF